MFDEDGLSITLTWKKVKSGICIQGKQLTEKYLSACGHAIALNSLIWSKLWYIAQVFLLPGEATTFL